MLPKYKTKANNLLLTTFREKLYPFLTEHFSLTPTSSHPLKALRYTILAGAGNYFNITIIFPKTEAQVEIGVSSERVWLVRATFGNSLLSLTPDLLSAFDSLLTPSSSSLYSACRDVYYKYPNKGGGTFYARGATVITVGTVLFARNLKGELLLTEEFPPLT